MKLRVGVCSFEAALILPAITRNVTDGKTDRMAVRRNRQNACVTQLPVGKLRDRD
jgi:hypothetical protein